MDRQQPESSDPRPGASGPPREPRAGRQPWRDEPDDVDEEYDEYGEPAPADYCYEFFKLLNEVRPFPYARVREIVRQELGGDPEAVFRSFEPEPFAAASIGQVHRAVLPSGRRVAVKVQ